MRLINKGKEPKELTEHSRQKGATYESFTRKQRLRESLYAEQRGICCYCMGQIVPKALRMKIEHFQCQDAYPALQLKYSNLLGACKGNEGQPTDESHCDTSKGNRKLRYNPAIRMIDISSQIQYGNDGTIRSHSNAALDKDINEILNLNIPKLKNARKGVLDGFKDVLPRKKEQLQSGQLKKWLGEWDGTSHSNNLNPYCMVVVYWLSRKLKKA